VTRKGARRRSDGIFYRQWNDTWYSSITGRKVLFYDSHGQRFKGRHNEAAAKRPSYAFRKPHSVLAHILVCFLAYVLWKTLAQWMRRSELGDAPRTLLEELAKIQSGDVALPTQTRQGQSNGTVSLRCVIEPDDARKSCSIG